MKATLLGASILSTAAITNFSQMSSAQVAELYDSYLIEHNKTGYSEAERSSRFSNFVDSLKNIEKLSNDESLHMEFGLNAYSDMGREEATDLITTPLLGDQIMSAGFETVDLGAPIGNNLPSRWDVRNLDRPFVSSKRSCMNPPRDQSRVSCSSGWAFAVAHAVQGTWCQKFNENVEFSPQMLVDCDTNQMGCRGARSVSSAMQWLTQNGICPLRSYPYRASQGGCRASACDPAEMGGTNSVAMVTPHTEVATARALVHFGPVVATLSFKGHEGLIRNYKRGYFTMESCNKYKESNAAPDHAYAIIGYRISTMLSKTMFLAQNSWGTSWGEQGLFWIEWGACGMDPKLSTVFVMRDQEAIIQRNLDKYLFMHSLHTNEELPPASAEEEQEGTRLAPGVSVSAEQLEEANRLFDELERM